MPPEGHETGPGGRPTAADIAIAEAEAFRLLGTLDVDGCRGALRHVAHAVTTRKRGSDDADRRAVVLWLYGILEQVHRRLERLEPRASRTTSRGMPDDLRWQMCRQMGASRDLQTARTTFLALLDELLGPWTERDARVRPVVERALVLIRENYHRRISLSSIADRLHVSANYLSRQFRRETGVTLTSYVHRVRLEHARALLAAGGRTISEIAYIVGYQNYRDFYRNFVKYEHASPSEVARRHPSRP